MVPCVLFFSSFGKVHFVVRSCHDAFPGLFDGNRLVKITLTKDILASVRVAGFDCRVWYRRQLASCSICKKLGHRGKSFPLDGLCRRCRQPGHVARECQNAWGVARVISAGPFSVPSTSAPSPAVSAPSAEVPSSDVPLVSGAVAAVDPSPVPDVPPSTDISLSVLLPSTALLSECEESDMEFVPAPVSDIPDSVTDEMCCGDEVICEAAIVAAAAAAADAPSSPRRPRRSHRNRNRRSGGSPGFLRFLWFLVRTSHASLWTCHPRTTRTHRCCSAPLMRSGTISCRGRSFLLPGMLVC